MSTEIILNYQQKLYLKRILNPWIYYIFLLLKLPMAWIAGLRVLSFSGERAHIGVKYQWLTQNPFKSIYFAVLSMAAEMSTGLLVMLYIQHKSLQFSMLVVGNEARFTKKAVGKITFKCEDGAIINEAIARAIATEQGVELKLTSIGYDQQLNEVAQFTFLWSVKVKKR